ncbi:MAG: hypothetical protein IPJ35_04315 [Elusimicrobia bacterium]|nr:hypothetical protein [Elusimicrobiota bacterium]
MIQNIDQVVAELKNGTLLEHRHSNIELKEDWDHKHGKDISAYANRLNSDLHFQVIGVNNSGKVVGKDEKWAKKTEEVISQHLNKDLQSTQAIKEIKCFPVEGGWIITITIQNPGAVVYWENQAYKAAGTTSARMTAEEIMDLTIKLPGLTDYSAQKWVGEAQAGLIKSISKLLGVRRPNDGFGLETQTSDDVLAKIGIASKMASRILFGDCKYRLVYYDKEETPVDNQQHSGLYNLLDPQFIEILQDWSKSQSGQDQRPYSSSALKEAFANAVAHSAYFENDGDIIVEVFIDHISISNLAVQDSTYFANKWFSKSHKTINRLLMETLRYLGFVDELGRGKNLIFSESIKNGKPAPKVIIEPSGLYNRWRLLVFGGTTDKKVLKLLSRIRNNYSGDEKKALIALALVLWRNQTLSEIRKFIDGDSVDLLVAVLSDRQSPVFYYKDKDRILLRRWAEVVLGEGKDSKAPTQAEEDYVRDRAYEYQTKHHQGYITTSEVRAFFSMGDTRSEISLSSTMLRRWHKQGFVEKVRKGTYRFKPKPPSTADSLKALSDLVRSINPK